MLNAQQNASVTPGIGVDPMKRIYNLPAVGEHAANALMSSRFTKFFAGISFA